jgi:hypothetical protein
MGRLVPGKMLHCGFFFTLIKKGRGVNAREIFATGKVFNARAHTLSLPPDFEIGEVIE